MSIGRFIGGSANYHLDGNSNDSSGNSLNGTDFNVSYSRADGYFDQGASFSNGTSSSGSATDYIRVDNNSVLSPGSGNFTIFSWFKTTDTNASNREFVRKYGSNTNNTYFLGKDTTHHLVFSTRDGDGDSVSAVSPDTINDGVWRLATGVRDGTTAYLYINGELVDSDTNVSLGTIDVNSAGYYLWIGTFGTNTVGPPNVGWVGQVDEVYLDISRAWSAGQIKRWYAWTQGKLD